jgi:LmbE family N-acetylglucosaminyl deacetylase
MRKLVKPELFPVRRKTILLALTLVFAYIMIYPYYIYDPQIELSPFPPLSPDDRILVLAPHPDDELLGAAGLLLEAEEKGVEAKIVIATNGDGYPWAARFSKYKFVVSSKDLIALGEKRMAESKSGIKRLGLSEEQLIFLGYPDRGLMPIWLEFWDQPFTSRFTRSSQAPYTGLYNNMELPYSGQYLVKTLKDLLLEFQPTIIVTPHPLDSHPDHCALTCFMLYAGELAKANGYTPRHVFGYLVHRGTWPHPRGYRPELGLNPPRSLGNLDLEWISLDLSPEAIKLKARAIREHRTQRLIMTGYLDSFTRKNELFSEIKAAFLPDDFQPVWVWHHPQSDTLARRFLPSADISGIQLQWDGSELHVMVHTFGRQTLPSRGELVLAIPCSEESRPLTVTIDKSKGEEKVRYEGSINIKALFGEDLNSILLLCRTRLGWWNIDSTPPILVILESLEE